MRARVVLCQDGDDRESVRITWTNADRLVLGSIKIGFDALKAELARLEADDEETLEFGA